jgi:hypothetical protein
VNERCDLQRSTSNLSDNISRAINVGQVRNVLRNTQHLSHAFSQVFDSVVQVLCLFYSLIMGYLFIWTVWYILLEIIHRIYNR